jgi:hypothetical protein
MAAVRGAADRRVIMIDVVVIELLSSASAGSIVFDDFDSGVSLRFTPGFMLGTAPGPKVNLHN